MSAFFVSLLRADTACPLVGGQAVMNGVMMRNGDYYGIAVRHPDGTITAERRRWFTLAKHPWLKKPFMRGFPTLLDTLVNGIRALNRSAEQVAATLNTKTPNANKETPAINTERAKVNTETPNTETLDTLQKLKSWQLVLTLLLALSFAIMLFVVTPHVMSLGMQWLGLGGDMDSLSFHVWDGLFKCLIFIAYIFLISIVPEIRQVFQYHGAEHKVIHAFESGGEVTAVEAGRMSRLHPRCGTTFLLFVITISIILHALLVPLLLFVWTPQNVVLKHTVTIVFKLLLMIPISALAYELIHYAARIDGGVWGKILRAPGLMLQMLTTYEPARDQLEVAVVALHEALGHDAPETVRPADYRGME